MVTLPLPLEKPLPSTCTLYHGDCLDVMPTLVPKTVQMCFADLPYGVSKCVWDCKIDLSAFSEAMSAIVCSTTWRIFTATQPFTTHLMNAMSADFRHDLIWQRTRLTGIFNAKRAPLRCHEHVLIFNGKGGTYNPIMETKRPYNVTTKSFVSPFYGLTDLPRKDYKNVAKRYPKSIISVHEGDLRNDSLNGRTEKRYHPTQKPVALLEWLIATYTNPGDTVLDPVMGSGTTAIACARLGRNFIGIEKDKTYFDVASKRIAAERERLGL